MDRKLIRTVSIGQREQASKFQEIDEERFYTIQCIFNNFCLRSQPKSFREGDYLRVTGNQLQQNYINQLWMFKKLTRTEYELVHVKSDLVLTVDDFQGRLEMGRQKQNQKFEIVPFKNGVVRIKDNSNNGVMHLDGILESVDYSQRDETQLFRLNSFGMFEIPWFKDTIFILTDDKTASLDLVNGARMDQREIIIYRKNLRMNQRWKFTLLQEGKNKNYASVYIISALTGMFVVLNKEGRGLMQASYPQEWLIEETEIKEYIYIRHAKLEEFLSYSEERGIYFSQTKKNKWYVQNGVEGLHLKRSMLARTSTI